MNGRGLRVMEKVVLMTLGLEVRECEVGAGGRGG